MTMPAEKDNFDRHAADYTQVLDRCLEFSGFSTDDFAERKVREMHAFLSAAGVDAGHLRILNFGCGIGNSEPHLARHFPGADIYSVDVSGASVEKAKERNRGVPGVQFSVFDGFQIPFPGTFDVVMMAGVLHHIQSDQRMDILSRVRDILAGDGSLFLFEHNPWNPLTRKIVRDCPFDENAELVTPQAARNLLQDSGFMRLKLCFIHFFPGSLRFLVPVERWLRNVPLGAQYCYCAGKKQFKEPFFK